MQNQFEFNAPDDNLPIDLHRYIYIISKWCWLLILIPCLTGALAYMHSRRISPIYQSRAIVLINEAPETKGADYYSMMLSERLSQTYAELMLTRATLEKVEAELNVPTFSLSGKIIAMPMKSNPQFIEIRVKDRNPEMAATIANTMVRVFSRDVVAMLHAGRFAKSKSTLQEQADKIERQIEATGARIQGSWHDSEKSSLEMRQAQYMQIYAQLLMNLEQVRMAENRATSNVILLEPAVSGHQVSPRTKRMMLMAGFMGFLLAAGAIFGINALDNTVKDPEDLSRQVNQPVLGVISTHRIVNGEMIAVREPRSPIAEAFRSLRTNIFFSGADKPLRSLMISSPTPTDGKSTVAANLAIVIAQSGKRVCLIDADMRRSNIHKLLMLPTESRVKGLSRLFIDEHAVLDDMLIKTEIDGLTVLPAGAHPPNPSELIGSEKMRKIIYQLQQQYDILLIDSPPAMTVTDAMLMASQIDGILLVFRPGKTKMNAMRQTVSQITRINKRLIGLVANNGRGYADYYYREHYSKYAYHYHEGSEAIIWRIWRKFIRLTGWGDER